MCTLHSNDTLRRYSLVPLQFPRYCCYRLFHTQWHKPAWGFSFWQSLSNRLGLRYRHCICNYHLCLYIRWPFQSRNHDLLCMLARLPLEKSAALYILPDFRCFHGGHAPDGHVLARDISVQSRKHRGRQGLGLQRRARKHPLLVPEPESDVR